MSSDSIIFLVLAAVVAAVILIAVASYFRRQRSQHLRDRFGPEYARVAQETGIAKGTVYLHYRDKQELLDEIAIPLTPVRLKCALLGLTTLKVALHKAKGTPLPDGLAGFGELELT